MNEDNQPFTAELNVRYGAFHRFFPRLVHTGQYIKNSF